MMKSSAKFLVAMIAVVSFANATGNLTQVGAGENDSLTELSTKPSRLPAYSYAGNDSLEAAISAYVVSEFGTHYTPSDVTIPIVNILATKSSKFGETLVWGSFWVLNYELHGDTLFCVSGGEYPGLAHLQQTKNGNYVVKKLEVVEDGAKFTKSAKRIFGRHYKSFMKIYSDQDVREKKRAESIRDYVKANGLQITKYQDYGWEAKAF